MQKLDSKKIDTALKNLENAAKGAVRSLNEMTDNQFKDSSLEKEPLLHLAYIVKMLEKAKEQVKIEAKYEGMDTDQITETQEQEREAELETIQTKFNEKLASRVRKPEPVEPEILEDVVEPEGDPDNEPQS